jgi:hypothetical protein
VRQDTPIEFGSDFGQDLFPLGNRHEGAKDRADTQRRPMTGGGHHDASFLHCRKTSRRGKWLAWMG